MTYVTGGRRSAVFGTGGCCSAVFGTGGRRSAVLFWKRRFNRSGMNRIKRILGIYKLECASINDMNIQVFLLILSSSFFTIHC